MAGITDYDCEGTLTISGISMNRPAWAIIGDEQGDGGLLGLITKVSQRGSDRRIPSSSGVLAYRRRVDVTEHELRILVAGDVDLSGAVTSDHNQGLAVNLAYLYTNIVAPVVSATGTRSASLAIPGLATRTADIHVVGFQQSEYRLAQNVRDGAIWEGRLIISIPAGRFV